MSTRTVLPDRMGGGQVSNPDSREIHEDLRAKSSRTRDVDVRISKPFLAASPHNPKLGTE